jgi:ParB-like chromosome segregation protein Spo0J
VTARKGAGLDHREHDGEARKSAPGRRSSSRTPKQTQAQTTTRYDFHPAANIFPLLEGEEFNALVADIKTFRLRERIKLFGGKILDGRNRYRALLAAGIKPTSNYFDHLPYVDPVAYVISTNIHRRHLKPEDRIKYLAQLVAAQPEKSDRQIAKEAGVSHPTIAKARQEAEATGKALPVAKRTGADGKARKQPAKKKTDAAKRAAEYRAAKERRENEAAAADFRAEIAAKKVEAEQIAVDLINLDRNLAQRLYAHLAGGESWLKEALGRGLGSEGNGADAEASADKRREQFAAIETEGDPGPIPEFLKRVAP